MPCVQCTDEPCPYMQANEYECETWGDITDHCDWNPSWVANQYCRPPQTLYKRAWLKA